VPALYSAPSNLRLGYLRQEAVLTFAGQENTVFAEMLSVFADLTGMEAELRRMEAQMAAGELDEALLEEYGRLQETYELGGGYAYSNEIKKVLQGLGFPPEEWETPLTHLSGGQKTRVLLGRLLLEKPDLLILDEPTNHLDTGAIEWLERTLRNWSGALLIVSHDRYFLDRVVNRIWEMAPDRLRSYKGDYSQYVRQRELEREREEGLFQAEKERLEKELAFVRKNIAGGKTDIAKGKAEAADARYRAAGTVRRRRDAKQELAGDRRACAHPHRQRSAKTVGGAAIPVREAAAAADQADRRAAQRPFRAAHQADDHRPPGHPALHHGQAAPGAIGLRGADRPQRLR
jgi:ATPase subunit of ABC transporter with duplicated ATPase domains